MRRLRAILLIGATFASLLISIQWAGASVLSPGEYEIRGSYLGVLPCADCAGVWTTITLDDRGINVGGGNGAYVMTERFTGGAHGGATVTTRGLWLTKVKTEYLSGTLELQGEENNGKKPAPRYFYCDHGRSLRLLDDRGAELRTSDRYHSTIQRIIPPAQPRFGPLTEADNRATIVGRVGDVFEINLHSPTGAWSMTSSHARSVSLVDQGGGSGSQNDFVRIFLCKAVVPGTANVEFRSADTPTRVVSFVFQVTPNPETTVGHRSDNLRREVIAVRR